MLKVLQVKHGRDRVDPLYIGAVWINRQESAHQINQRLLRLFQSNSRVQVVTPFHVFRYLLGL